MLIDITRNPGVLVKFLIGPDNKEPAEFMIHKEFACYHSPVFDAAFNGPFVEGQTQTYRMDDTTKGSFPIPVAISTRREIGYRPIERRLRSSERTYQASFHPKRISIWSNCGF
jgi:hypothetical protein